MIRLTSFLCFLLSSQLIDAQIVWSNVDAAFGELPKGMHVFFTKSALDGKANRAYYAIVPLNSKQYKIVTDTTLNRRLTPQQFYEKNNQPLLVVNGTFFSFETNRNLNVVIQNNRLVSYNTMSVWEKKNNTYRYLSRSAFGISNSGKADVAWVITDSSKAKAYEVDFPILSTGSKAKPSWKTLKQDRTIKKWKMKTAIGGGPRLLQNGDIFITNNEEKMFADTAIYTRHPRTAIGYTAKNEMIILVVEGRNPGIAEGASLIHLAEMLKDLGCIEALNLDGGGSSCMLINGEPTIQVSDKTGQRPVPAVLMVAKH